MSSIQRWAAPIDSIAISSEGRDAWNLICNQNGAVVAFAQVHGSTQALPLGQPLPLAIKNLYPVVLAIAY